MAAFWYGCEVRSRTIRFAGRSSDDGSPSFFLHFKPRIGDFSVKKLFNSSGILVDSIQSDIKSGENGVGLELSENSDLFSVERINGVLVRKTAERLITGAEVCATTAMPLPNHSVAKFRWSIIFAAEDSTFRNMPYLTLNKIGIEHMAVNKQKPECSLSGSADVAGACLAAKRELDVLQVESVLLRKQLAELGSGAGVPGENVRVGGGDSGGGSEVEMNNEGSIHGKKKNKGLVK